MTPQLLTRREMAQRLALSAPLTALLLSEAACNSGPTLVSLLTDLIQDGSQLVDIAFPQYSALLTPIVAELTTFAGQVTNELDSTDTTAQKIAAIIMYAGMVAKPNLPGTVPQDVITRVDALVAIVPQIVSLVQQLKASIDTTSGGAEAFFAAHNIKPPSKRELAKLRAKNAELQAKLAKLGKK